MQSFEQYSAKRGRDRSVAASKASDSAPASAPEARAVERQTHMNITIEEITTILSGIDLCLCVIVVLFAFPDWLIWISTGVAGIGSVGDLLLNLARRQASGPATLFIGLDVLSILARAAFLWSGGMICAWCVAGVTHPVMQTSRWLRSSA